VFLSCVFINFIFVFLTSGQDYNSGMQKRIHFRTDMEHGHFHIGLVIIPRPILVLDSVSGQYGGLGMITRLIWKCPCINPYLLYLTLYIIYKIKVMFSQNWYPRKTSLLFTGRQMLCSMSVRKCIRFSIPEL
jgi:hypothetical protein